MHSVAPKETIQHSLAIQDEVGDGTMKQGDQQPEYQIGEIRNHTSSLAICQYLPIRRGT